MSITSSQNKPIVIGTPVEIDDAVNEIRKVIMALPWLTRPYFIAQRFIVGDKKKFIFPETYTVEPRADGSKKRGYFRLTPDKDFQGRSFFLVGSGKIDHSDHRENKMTYPVALIFSVNLELIDPVKLDEGLFTRELMRDVRKLLTQTRMNHLFDYNLERETDDLREVFREFSMENIEDYNRAPMQCFRFDLSITVSQDC